MQLYQVLRKVVPDHYAVGDEDDDDPKMVLETPGLTQVVWEGRSHQEATRQLDTGTASH